MVGTLEFMSPEVGFNPILDANYYCTFDVGEANCNYAYARGQV
jgi:hypothetical protein